MEDARDYVRCGKRKHTLWADPIGNMLSYLCEPRPWANKIVAIPHNAKAYDLHFSLNRAILLKWKPELITNEAKIICMKIEHLDFLDIVSVLPYALRKLHEAFGLSASKSRYTHYFNTEENLNYVGPIPDVSYYGVKEMSEEERKEFLVWYEKHKFEPFEKRAYFKRTLKMKSMY